MNNDQVDAAVLRVRDAMDAILAPAFLLSVDSQGEVRFVGINATTEADTGLRSADLEGLTPREAFPARMADTVMANYAKCIASKERYTYEEVLDVPSGAKHSRTTLSPVFSDRSPENRIVVGVVGIGSDITAQKMEMRRLVDGASTLRRQCEDTWTEATGLAERLRGPLAMIATLAKTLPDNASGGGGSAPTPASSLILAAAEEALNLVDGIGFETARTHGARSTSSVDLGHLVRDELALIDPNAQLSATYPRLMLRTDPSLIENILHRCMELVSMDVGSFVRVTVAPLAMDIHALRLRVTFDTSHQGTGQSGRREARRALENLLASYGSALHIDWDGEHGETTLEMSIPGRIDFRAPAEASRMRPEGLTAPTPSGRALARLSLREQADVVPAGQRPSKPSRLALLRSPLRRSA